MSLSARETLLISLDQAFDRKSWHGTNLKGSIRGLTAREAAWRPGAGRRSIWEIVLHCAYWKYVVRRRLLGEKRGSFARSGSDWPQPSFGRPASWKEDVRLLVETHASMKAAIAGLPDRELRAAPRGSAVDNLALITGVIAHDLHHTGQIQLVKRLGAGGRKPSRRR